MAEPYEHDDIRLGNFLLTIVEPHKGHEVAYNRWYERDHFYSGCMIGPWTLAGGRFVATRDCKARRTPNDAVGSYIALYWIQDGKYKEWVEWAGAQVMWLHENGRMFKEREHIHTQMYKYRGGVFRDDDGVPPELALDHPYQGLGVVLGEAADGVEPGQVDEWYQSQPLPASAGMCLSGTPRELRRGPSDVPRAEGSDRKFVRLFFLDDDPLVAWDKDVAAHNAAFEKTGLGAIEFASPFLRTIPGTDTYTNELW